MDQNKLRLYNDLLVNPFITVEIRDQILQLVSKELKKEENNA